MARRTRRPAATAQTELAVVTTACPGCGRPMTIDYYNRRTLTTLQGVVRFQGSCAAADCPGN
jgi:hypothetical protein